MSRSPLLVPLAALLAGCGGTAAPTVADAEPAAAERTAAGIEAAAPAGWDVRVRRGALHAASVPLPAESLGWMRALSEGLPADDAAVLLFEREPELDRSPPSQEEYPELDGPPALRPGEFGARELVDDPTDEHGHARRLFSLSGRSFVLFVEAGSRPPAPRTLAQVNELLASLRVEPGDHHPGSVEPPRFRPRPGWHVGDAGPSPQRADGELTTAWASTIPYRDDWNALPMTRTLEQLPTDGVTMWVSVERNNRYPPTPEGDATFPPVSPPFELDDLERLSAWQGQVRDVPQYRLWGTVRGEYRLDLRVYFGRSRPTDAMRSETQAMLDDLELPTWGPWE